jgi:hypothetical protein
MSGSQLTITGAQVPRRASVAEPLTACRTQLDNAGNTMRQLAAALDNCNSKTSMVTNCTYDGTRPLRAPEKVRDARCENVWVLLKKDGKLTPAADTTTRRITRISKLKADAKTMKEELDWYINESKKPTERERNSQGDVHEQNGIRTYTYKESAACIEDETLVHGSSQTDTIMAGVGGGLVTLFLLAVYTHTRHLVCNSRRRQTHTPPHVVPSRPELTTTMGSSLNRV